MLEVFFLNLRSAFVLRDARSRQSHLNPCHLGHQRVGMLFRYGTKSLALVLSFHCYLSGSASSLVRSPNPLGYESPEPVRQTQRSQYLDRPYNFHS